MDAVQESSHPEWTLGTSTFHFEPPEVLWSRIRGDFRLTDAIRMVEIYRELGSVRPLFILGDMEEARGMEDEARRYLSDHVQPEWLRGIIYFNTRLVHRAIAQGLLLASEMTRAEPSHLRGKLHFVSTQAKARALLAQLRAQ